MTKGFPSLKAKPGDVIQVRAKLLDGGHMSTAWQVTEVRDDGSLVITKTTKPLALTPMESSR